jgi:hypothetical protein
VQTQLPEPRAFTDNQPKKPEAPKPATTPAGTKPATTPAATTPAATTPKSGAKVAPTAAPTAAAKPATPAPAGQTGDKAKDMATFSKANPKLAAASAERDRTRGTSATTNPLMKDMKSRLPAPKPAAGNTLSQTAAAASKPAAFNPTSSAAPKPSTPPAAASSTSPVNKARGSSKPEEVELWVQELINEGYDLSDYTWDEIVEIYEDYKPWDFGPKQKAQAKHSQLVQRKEAGGSPRGTATRANKIASVGREMRTTLDKNSAATGANPAKQGLQPATQRHTAAAMRGAGGGTTATKAYNVKPLKSSRGGSSSLGGVGNASGTQRYTPGAGGRYGLAGTGLADEFELWVQELINEGYDLSDYTWDEIVEIYEETEEEKKKNERRARVAELQASGRVMTSSRRTSERAKKRREEQRAERLERLANAALEDERGAKRRSSTPMGSTQPTSKESAPKANRILSSSMKKDTLASKADELLRMLQNENFQLWTNELLDEGYELDNWTDEELVELYIEIFG